MRKNNPYGYKVGYRESGSQLFIKHFMTYTYNQALSARRFYRKAPQRTRDTNRPIIDPFWEIKPITKKEYLAGIWNEPPFPYKKRHRAGDVPFYSCSFIHCNKSSYCIFPSANRKPASTTSSSVTSSGIPFTSKNVSNTYIPIRLFPSTNA